MIETGVTAEFQSLLAKQEELENASLSLGRERFTRRLEEAQRAGKASTVGAGRKLLVEAILPLEKAIRHMVEEAYAPGRRGPKKLAARWCREMCEACEKKKAEGEKVVCTHAVGAETAAYITAKVILDGLTKRTNLRKAQEQIVELIQDELRYRRFRDKAPILFEYKLKSFTTSNYAHMARSMDAAVRTATCLECYRAGKVECPHLDMSDLEMPEQERRRLGQDLVELFVQSTGLVDVQAVLHMKRSKRDHQRTEHILVPKPDTLKWLYARNSALEMLFPVNLPMVVPPLPWGPNQRGGYMFAMKNKYPFVRGTSKQTLARINQQHMPTVYAAVNRIQETAWRINPAVLSLLQEIDRRGGNMAGVPKTEPIELPQKPQKQWASDEERKADPDWRKWRKAAGVVRNKNHQRKIAVKLFRDLVALAKKFSEHPAIFFPHNVDFRGRIYPITAGLNPQGDDIQKALLTFAQGKPLTEEGAAYLAVHGANCLETTPDKVKLTKASIEERIQWVQDNTARIRQVARDPFADLWWTEADSPFCFYAFCVEWDNLLTAWSRGEEYVCTLPVSMDGTCNGLQHFAAMLRDEVGGEAVNVVPTSRPNDIYNDIADDVLDLLTKMAADEPLAALWLSSGLVGRKLCKRPTMTFGYGSKQFGFKAQLQEYLRGLGDDEWARVKEHFTVDEKNMVPQACSLMAKLIMEALRFRVRGAFSGMAWMQKAVRGVVANGLCVEWVVPGTGFLVRQEYMKAVKKQIRTVLNGAVYKPTIYEQTSEPNPVKQANAVAPNFVHSLDAAALMMTVEMASNDGVESFCMIHDSYGTLPTDAPILARCTREAFFKLYSQHDVLRELGTQLREHCANPEKFPSLPEYGSLDIADVIESRYFFS